MFFEGRGSKTLVKPMFLEKPPFFETSVKPRFQKKGRSMGGGGYHIYIYIYLYIYIYTYRVGHVRFLLLPRVSGSGASSPLVSGCPVWRGFRV